MEFKKTFVKEVKSPKDVLEIDGEMQKKDAAGNSIYDSYSAKYGDKYIKYSFVNNALNTIAAPAPVVANPYYVYNVTDKALNGAIKAINAVPSDFVKDNIIQVPSANDDTKQCAGSTVNITELQRELEMYKISCQESKKERDILVASFNELTEKYNKEYIRANGLELDLINKESGIDKNDVRGLCKALYDLGFDVELTFVDDKE